MPPMTYPEECPFCKSSRAGIQESKSFFRCGTVAARTKEGLRWTRPVECVLSERGVQVSYWPRKEGKKIQAGQTETAAK